MSRALQAICEPFNGEELQWHAVTPAMSNMKYAGADTADVYKKPNIASFFKPKAGKTCSQNPQHVVHAASAGLQHWAPCT